MSEGNAILICDGVHRRLASALLDSHLKNLPNDFLVVSNLHWYQCRDLIGVFITTRQATMG